MQVIFYFLFFYFIFLFCALEKRRRKGVRNLVMAMGSMAAPSSVGVLAEGGRLKT